jgi:pyrimidine operon attenuation protein/uracil phosphoribosyltransferase
MNKLIAIVVAVFALNAVAADRPTVTKKQEVKVKQITLKRIVKYQIHHADDDVILIDDVPTYGRNRNYYTWNKLVDCTLPDEIKLRLALARIKALEKYKEVWG